MDFTSNDLVLRLVDGTSSGQFFPIRTQKCLLGNKLDRDANDNRRCAIFRGPNGTAIRSDGESVTVNGQEVNTAWLTKGDQIHLGDSIIEVYQLGRFPDQRDPPSSQAPHHLVEEEPHQHLDRIHSDWSEPITDLENRMDEQLGSLREQASSFASRFDDLESQMEELTHTLTIIANSVGGHSHSESPDVGNDQSELQQHDSQERPEYDSSLTSNQSLEVTVQKAMQTSMPEPCDEDTLEEPAPQQDLEPAVEESRVSDSRNESVADVVARMQSHGQLDGYQADLDEGQQASVVPHEDPEPHFEEPPASSATDVQEELSGGDGSVEDYMNKLLGRTGDKKPEFKPETPEPAPSATALVDREDAPEAKAPESVAILTSSEFKPSKVAPESDKHMDAMRELANQNNRIALNRVKQKRARVVQITNFSIMGLGFLLSVYLIATSAGLGDLIFWAGALALGLSLGIGAIAVKSLISSDDK